MYAHPVWHHNVCWSSVTSQFVPPETRCASATVNVRKVLSIASQTKTRKDENGLLSMILLEANDVGPGMKFTMFHCCKSRRWTWEMDNDCHCVSTFPIKSRFNSIWLSWSLSLSSSGSPKTESSSGEWLSISSASFINSSSCSVPALITPEQSYAMPCIRCNATATKPAAKWNVSVYSTFLTYYPRAKSLNNNCGADPGFCFITCSNSRFPAEIIRIMPGSHSGQLLLR